MSKSPFYRTGISKSPLLDTGDGSPHVHNEDGTSSYQPKGKMMATITKNIRKTEKKGVEPRESVPDTSLPTKSIDLSVPTQDTAPVDKNEYWPTLSKDLVDKSNRVSTSNSLADSKNNLKSARQEFRTAKKEKRKTTRADKKNTKADKIRAKTSKL